MAKQAARLRLRAWIDEQNLSITDAARRMRISRSLLSQLLHGSRMPGRQVASIIEIHSNSWDKGPIRVIDWDL